MILEKPYMVMGIVNVTEDSFYDGGKYFDSAAAVAHGLRLVEEGADIIDVGGSSSRPGAKLLSPQEEAERVVPVITGLARCVNGVPISVDTTWSYTAKAAIRAGATIVNDISAGRLDPDMAHVVVGENCSVVLMHSRGTPETMQGSVFYGDLIEDLCDELGESVDKFWRAGIAMENVIVDPGFGFAKSAAQNIELLSRLGEFADKIGYPVLVGLSRKSFIGGLTGDRPVGDRLMGTLAATAAAFSHGAKIFRVHDVAATVEFLGVLAVAGCGRDDYLEDTRLALGPYAVD